MQFDEAAEMIKASPDMQRKLREAEDPVAAIQEISDNMPLRTDKWIYRGVTLSLGLVSLMTALGTLVLAFYGKPIPGEAIGLGATALGALAGLLAKPPQ